MKVYLISQCQNLKSFNNSSGQKTRSDHSRSPWPFNTEEILKLIKCLKTVSDMILQWIVKVNYSCLLLCWVSWIYYLILFSSRIVLIKFKVKWLWLRYCMMMTNKIIPWHLQRRIGFMRFDCVISKIPLSTSYLSELF